MHTFCGLYQRSWCRHCPGNTVWCRISCSHYVRTCSKAVQSNQSFICNGLTNLSRSWGWNAGLWSDSGLLRLFGVTIVLPSCPYQLIQLTPRLARPESPILIEKYQGLLGIWIYRYVYSGEFELGSGREIGEGISAKREIELAKVQSNCETNCW